MYQSLIALIMECHLPSIRFLWRLLPRLAAVCYKGGEPWICLVARREDGRAPSERPLDTDLGVVPGDGKLLGRIVRRALLIGDDGFVFQCKEAVQKSARHVNLLPLGSGERASEPSAVRRALRSQIDDRVEDAAANDADQFSHAPIAVQAAQYAAARERNVVLNELVLYSALPITIARVRFPK